MRALFLAGLLAISGAASAADRGYSVEDFDRIRVEGPYAVNVHVGPPSAVRAVGAQTELDRLAVTVSNGTLIIRPDRSGWGGWPGAGANQKLVVNVATRVLSAVAVVGSGEVAVDRIRGENANLGIAGSGDLKVGMIQADSVLLSIAGSGDLAVAGMARQVRASIQGSGTLDAAALRVQDATVSTSGSGDLKLTASRTAKVTTAGSGDVVIFGPATCTVNRVGSGDVSCGRGG